MTRGESVSRSLRESVGERASALLTDRLCGSLERCGDDPGLLKQALDRVRTSMRLFVDESVADDIDRRLRTIAGLPQRAPAR